MVDAFAPKEIIYDDEMYERLESGVKAVHDAVGRTMGPAGQLVMYEENYDNPYPTVTKDGVSVASMIAFDDQAKNNGAQFVIQAARKQVYETGDGTTLTSILTYKIFKEGRKLISAGFSPNGLITGIRNAVKDSEAYLENMANKDVTAETLINIARIATNNDNDLAEKIGEAVEKTGKYGMVLHERSQNDKHEVEYQNGYQMNIGIQAREFANVDGKVMVLSEPNILVTDHKIVDATRLMPILKKIKAETPEGEKPTLIIISNAIGGDLLQVMKRNITDEQGQFFMVHIRPSKDLKPEKNRMIMEDLAAITGARFISEDSGYQIDKLELDMLGTCNNISSYPDKTLISGYNEATVEERIAILTSQLELTDDAYTKELIEESLAKLTGGVATIRVGGRNITDQTEAMFRVDDAVRACKSAQEMGYVRGGGVAMLETYRELNAYDLPLGYGVVLEALKYPAKTILTNGKREDWQKIISDITISNKVNGYDIKTGETDKDMYELNIIDPAKVIIYALKNAASAAISMLQTSVMIIGVTDDKKKNK